MNFSRSTTAPSFLDLVNVMSRGGTTDWQSLYARAKDDPGLRADLQAALALVDPEIGEGRALWAFLLDRLDHVRSVERLVESGRDTSGTAVVATERSGDAPPAVAGRTASRR